jgi:dolichyl-phosphate-mannose-protein mannosyltransferase
MNAFLHSHLCLRAIFLCAAFLFFGLTPRHARAEQNLLQNGNFAKGSEDQPDEWRTEAWINKPEAFVCHWHPSTDGAGELEVNNLQPNDGRWMQPLSLGPGWYQLSVDIRTENVGTKEDGASISVMEDGIMSPEIRGTAGWQRVSLYLKVGGHGADIDVALRVGGFASLNTGRAFFRNATLVAIAEPPPNAAPTFDLNAIRLEAAPVPIGSHWSLVFTFAVLVAIAYLGWRMFDDNEMPKVPQRPARTSMR